MKIRPKIGPDCYAAVNAASGERLNKEAIDAAFQRLYDYRESLKASGNIDGMADKLKKFAEREAERTKVAAAMQKRHAALNILVRDRLNQSVDSLMAQGLTPRKAILAVLEGTQRGVEGGRNSVAALNGAYEARYVGGMMSELAANKPHMLHTLADPKMDADILREMGELREGGKPGITGNADAKYAAKLFASYAEMSRTDLNRLGASIGKLDGWAGAQTHDDVKMIQAGKDRWVASVASKLDIARTFPDVSSADEIAEALSGVYDTIVTGMPNKATAREKGARVNPANLAKSLGKSRVLHFKDADAALAYREEFGYGNTVSGIASHLRNAARMAANMEALGPNPEIMFNSLVDGVARKIRNNPNLSPTQKDAKLSGLMGGGEGQLRNSFDTTTGLVSRPVNVTAAKIGSDIRAVESMAKLGGAVFSSVSDNVTAAMASMFRGSGFVKGLTSQIDGMMRGRPKGEQAEIAYMIGEGFDGILGHIVAPAAAQDGPVGRLSRLQEKFFKWNGLTWWTDVQRATAGRVISAEMGMRAKTAFADLPANYRHVLGLHGIAEKQWDAIRKVQGRESNGKFYITPDRIRELSDEDVAGLGKTGDDARRNLELAVLRFFADETSYGIVEVDNSTRRMMMQGTRPGTFAGESLRFVAQFKGFPMAFTNRVVGRAFYGHRKGAGALERTAHIGTLLAGMTVAGYMAMTMKDLMKGYWPPRDPSDPATWAAAFVQGGAAGIYGDYLFAQTNRFGGGPLETLAGPTIGAGADAIEIFLAARDVAIGKATGDEANFPAARALTLATNNTPFANLFYVRPALDYLFLNSMREAASPGYLRKQEKRRMSDYGQSKAPMLPSSLRPFN